MPSGPAIYTKLLPLQFAGDQDNPLRVIHGIVWFNEKTTEAGRDALGYYHERKDENRNVGIGPEHDWSSHAADAFGYMAISYEEPPASNSSGFNGHRSPESSGPPDY